MVKYIAWLFLVSMMAKVAECYPSKYTGNVREAAKGGDFGYVTYFINFYSCDFYSCGATKES